MKAISKVLTYLLVLTLYSLPASGISCFDFLQEIKIDSSSRFSSALVRVFAESKIHLDHALKAEQFMNFYLRLGLDLETASFAYTDRAKLHPDRVVADFYRLRKVLDAEDKIIAMLVAQIDPGVNMLYVRDHFLKMKSEFGVNDEAAVILFSRDNLRSSNATATPPVREFRELELLLADLNLSDRTLAHLFRHPDALDYPGVVTKSFREFRRHFRFLPDEMQALVFLSPKNNGFYNQVRTRFDSLYRALGGDLNATAQIMAGSTNSGVPSHVALRYQGFKDAVVEIMVRLAKGS